jgi:hypothetical protein
MKSRWLRFICVPLRSDNLAGQTHWRTFCGSVKEPLHLVALPMPFEERRSNRECTGGREHACIDRVVAESIQELGHGRPCLRVVSRDRQSAPLTMTWRQSIFFHFVITDVIQRPNETCVP